SPVDGRAAPATRRPLAGRGRVGPGGRSLRFRRHRHPGGPGPARSGAQMSRLAPPTRITAIRGQRHLDLPDRLAAEEPMEIRVGGPVQEPTPISVTMRTPGHDFELAVGFLRSEALLADSGDIASVSYCDAPMDEAQRHNVVSVRLTRPVDLD